MLCKMHREDALKLFAKACLHTGWEGPSFPFLLDRAVSLSVQSDFRSKVLSINIYIYFSTMRISNVIILNVHRTKENGGSEFVRGRRYIATV